MITLHISTQIGVNVPTTRDMERDIARSVKVAAEFVRSTWMSAVSGTVLPGMRGPVHDEAYLRSLGMPSALKRSDHYEYSVTADYERVAIVELGFASFDMKPMLLGGQRVRRAKDGRRYNIIPFRFGTPQSGGAPRAHFGGEQTMPRWVHEIVRLGDPFPSSDLTGQRTKIHELWSEQGELVGGVNAEALIRSLQGPMAGPYTWVAGLYSGMRRVGAPGQRQYFTFRTVSEPEVRWRRIMRPDGKVTSVQVRQRGSDPNSWIHPGRGANPVMRAVVDYTSPTVRSFLERAVGVATGT